MINELFERELRSTSINDVYLADYVKENYILKSVIEDIKSEIRSIQPKWHENAGKHNCIDEVIKIIDKHISRKENN